METRYQKKIKFEKTNKQLFEISVKKDKFNWDVCCFFEVALFYVGPPAFFFSPEISISGFVGHAHL